MALKKVNMLLLDGAGLAALAGLLSEMPPLARLLSEMSEDNPDKDVRTAASEWLARVAFVTTTMSNSISRCDEDYSWITQQLDPENTIVPTHQ